MGDNTITLGTELAVPSKEAAERYLLECSFDDRLVGVLMKSSGTLPTDIYSLEQVLGFFGHDNTDVYGSGPAVLEERKLAVAYLAPERLVRWITEIVGDHELAAAVSAEVARIEEPNVYPPRMRIMRELVVTRVLQCYDVLGIELTTPAGTADVDVTQEQEQ